jgi:hypothetical protein
MVIFYAKETSILQSWKYWELLLMRKHRKFDMCHGSYHARCYCMYEDETVLMDIREIFTFYFVYLYAIKIQSICHSIIL